MGSWCLYFCITLGILIGLLYLTALIPNTAFKENLLTSAQYLEENEDEFYRLIEDDRRTEIDNYADVILFNIMYSIDGDDLWDELMMAPFYSDHVNEEYPMIRLLQERIAEDKLADTIYDRYWHGMMILMRPLICVFTITQIRVVMLIVLLGLLALLSVQMWRKELHVPVLAVWVAAVLVGYPMISQCVEYQSVWLIMIGISLAALKCYHKPRVVAGLMVICGVCCAFFDFLTTETVAIVLPLAIVLCLCEKEGLLKNFRQGLFWLIWWGASWGIAYIGTLVVKWGLASIVIGQERFSFALSVMLQRQGGNVPSINADCVVNGAESLQNFAIDTTTTLPQSLIALLVNIRLMLGLSEQVSLQGMLIGVLVVVGIMLCIIYLFRKTGEKSVLPTLLFLLGSIPVLRIMVLNSHSLQHCLFVYRALFATIVCMITGFVYIIDWKFVKKILRINKNNRNKR